MVCYLPGILDWVVVANVEAEDFVESLWAFDIRSAHNLGYSTGWLESCFFGTKTTLRAPFVLLLSLVKPTCLAL